MDIVGLHVLDWGVLLLYIAGITVVGLRANRSVRSSGDYFMGGRRFGRVLMAAQAFGTGTRTDQAVAVIGASAQIGLSGIWYQWVYLFSTPFFWIIAPVYRRLRYLTVGDFFEQRFGSAMGATYALVGLAYFSIEIGIMLKAAGVTIEGVTAGGIPAEAAVIAMMLFFLAYGLFGGLVAVVTTQFVQGLFILMLSVLLIPFALGRIGGPAAAHAALPAPMFDLTGVTEVTPFFVVMGALNALIGVAVQPHNMALNGAGKDERSCRTGWPAGTFVKRIATLGWAFTGLFLAVLFPALATAGTGDREQAFGMAAAYLLPDGLVGLMVAALVAGVVAASNAFMVNGSALFTRNFYLRYLHRGATERDTLRVARACGVLLVVSGVTAALLIPSVVGGLILVWKITAFLGIAFWTAVAWRRANRYGAWGSMGLAAAVALTTEALGWSFPAQVALYLPLGFVCMVVTSRLTPPEPEERLRAFYTLLHTPVGQEARLRAAGIEIVHESEAPGDARARGAFSGKAPDRPPDPPGAATGGPGEENGQGLLVVDLLDLPARFRILRYRIDLAGFLICWILVLGLLALAVLLARLGA